MTVSTLGNLKIAFERTQVTWFHQLKQLVDPCVSTDSSSLKCNRFGAVFYPPLGNFPQCYSAKPANLPTKLSLLRRNVRCFS